MKEPISDLDQNGFNFLNCKMDVQQFKIFGVSRQCFGKNHKPVNTRSHICMRKAELSLFEYFALCGNSNIC